MGQNLCVFCKGYKHLCGNNPCPLLSKLKIAPKIVNSLKRDFFGPSNSVFVGSEGYPKVNYGPLGLIGSKNDMLTNPRKWYGLTYEEIIRMTSLIVRAKKQKNVNFFDKFVEQNQQLSASIKPIDIEINFKNKPKYNFSFSDIDRPIAISANFSYIKIVENPKIPHKVDYILNDDLKATEQINLLYESKVVDNYKIIDIFSSGATGIDKKIVPTRWSITAIDDILSKEFMKKIREYRSVEKFFVCESEYLHNRFVILLMPGKWEFENFEAWSPGTAWSKEAKEYTLSEEYEPFNGRTKYADKQVGGYYASRFAVTEFLNRIKRQARVIVFREIGEGYVIPVGVWEVRENVRHAFMKKPEVFSNLSEALNYISSKLKVPFEKYKKMSKILAQRKLIDF